MIRRAIQEDMAAVEAIYDELFAYEKKNGSTTNWVQGVYPTRATAEKAMQDGALYVLEEDREICASVVLNQFQAEVYNEVQWEYSAEDSEVLVIHTLCIPPSKAGKGYGRIMVDFALNLAKETGCKVVRLDTYVGNEPAAALYGKKFGFRYAGKAATLHEGVIPEELIFFEHKIK